MQMRDALDQAIASRGTQTQFAREMNITVAAVSGWKLRGRVPAERVLEIETLTGVPRGALRPDIYPEGDNG